MNTLMRRNPLKVWRYSLNNHFIKSYLIFNQTDAPVFIISHHFWPEIKEVEIDLPNQIQKSFDEFKEGFEKQKVIF